MANASESRPTSDSVVATVDAPSLSIGALSRATGVPAETLRTWERRYGFPRPERTESGHRRYPASSVGRLRLVTRALELGHKPSVALSSDEGTLRSLLAITETEPASADPAAPRAEVRPAPRSAAREPIDIQRWLDHVRGFEGEALELDLRRAWGALGALDFLLRGAGPFLTEVGNRWYQGELGVRHEHFASERLRDFLTSQWRPLSDAATGPHVVCATLPGEQHVLGLQMAAVVLALANLRVVFLGADIPPGEVAVAAHAHKARAVVISAASSADDAELQRQTMTLLDGLDPEIEVVVGGGGFATTPSGTQRFRDFRELTEWAQRNAVA